MSYVPGTILVLKDQQPDNSETGEPHPYNRIKFITDSPAQPLDTDGWKGADATYGVYTPLSNFGGNLHQPYGRIRQLYEVEYIPPVASDGTPGAAESKPRVKTEEEQLAELREWEERAAQRAKAQRTPEEVFAEEAPGKASGDGSRVTLADQQAFLDEVRAPSEQTDDALDALDGGNRGYNPPETVVS